MASDRAKRMLARYVAQGQTEQVTYRPVKDGLEARTIDVLVDRSQPAEAVMSGTVLGMRITALNDAVLGIPSNPDLSDIGKDTIDVAERVGGTAATRGLQQYLSQDADWVTLSVL